MLSRLKIGCRFQVGFKSMQSLRSSWLLVLLICIGPAAEEGDCSCPYDSRKNCRLISYNTVVWLGMVCYCTRESVDQDKISADVELLRDQARDMVLVPVRPITYGGGSESSIVEQMEAPVLSTCSSFRAVCRPSCPKLHLVLKQDSGGCGSRALCSQLSRLVAGCREAV